MLNHDKNIKIVNRKKKENSVIVKKKGLYLGLLVSLVGVGNVMQAMGWTATIKNNTPYTVRFKPGFSSRDCGIRNNNTPYIVGQGLKYRMKSKTPGTNERDLASGNIAKLTASRLTRMCSVTSMRATLQRPGLPAVEVRGWYSGKSRGIKHGSFVISGSDKTGYRITWTK